MGTRHEIFQSLASSGIELIDIAGHDRNGDQRVELIVGLGDGAGARWYTVIANASWDIDSWGKSCVTVFAEVVVSVVYEHGPVLYLMQCPPAEVRRLVDLSTDIADAVFAESERRAA